MDLRKKAERIIKSADKALDQLDKLITQTIDLTELDPEKAKAAAQGKIEAIEGSFKILRLIQEEEEKLNVDTTQEKKSFFGVENRVK